MGKNRLEAFSDGVIAILITIMVLELKVPHSPDFRALIPLWPVFMSYVLSFIYIGIYWNKLQYANHPSTLQNLNSMNVSATISRRDIFLVSLLALPRVRSNWYFLAIFGGATFVFLMMKVPVSATTVFPVLLVSVFTALGALLGGFLANSARALLALEKNSGVLGTHEFSLSPEQLQETTAFNDSKYTWAGIQSIERHGSYILVRINKYLIYVIPHRSFSSDHEFEAFFDQATAWKRAAEKNIEA